LDETKLYRSTGWQMIVGEFFSFSVANKVVFLYQVSSKLPKAHPFKLGQCALWRKALNMPAEWTLAIVYFVDQARNQLPTGIEFEDGKHLSAEDAKSYNLKAFVVRAQLHPTSKPIAYGGPPAALADETKIYFTPTSKTFHTDPLCTSLRGAKSIESTYSKREGRNICKNCRSKS